MLIWCILVTCCYATTADHKLDTILTQSTHLTDSLVEFVSWVEDACSTFAVSTGAPFVCSEPLDELRTFTGPVLASWLVPKSGEHMRQYVGRVRNVFTGLNLHVEEFTGQLMGEKQFRDRFEEELILPWTAEEIKSLLSLLDEIEQSTESENVSDLWPLIGVLLLLVAVTLYMVGGVLSSLS